MGFLEKVAKDTAKQINEVNNRNGKPYIDPAKVSQPISKPTVYPVKGFSPEMKKALGLKKA